MQVFTKTLRRCDLSEDEWQARLLLEYCLQCAVGTTPEVNARMSHRNTHSNTNVCWAQEHLNEPSPPFQLLSVEDLVPEETARNHYAEVAS